MDEINFDKEYFDIYLNKIDKLYKKLNNNIKKINSELLIINKNNSEPIIKSLIMLNEDINNKEKEYNEIMDELIK